jgi:hypothetical protein
VAAGSGTQLFRVARTSPLRIYVNVSQEFAQLVNIGVEGDLTVPEFPGRTFPAHVTNAAGAVDSASRSLQTDGKVEIRKVTIHLNLGDKLEISQGLSDSDQVIVNASDGFSQRHESQCDRTKSDQRLPEEVVF